MNFHNFTTLRDATKRSGVTETADEFYRAAFAAAVAQGSGQFYGQLMNEGRQEGLTVEEALQEIGSDELAELGVQIPDSLVIDCVRLCCSLCLLENDPSVIEPDVLSKDRAKYEASGDEKYIDKAHRRGKVGWNVGKRMEVVPHYRRPHMMLAWTGSGRAVPRIVPRRGSVVHREKVEKVPSGFDA